MQDRESGRKVIKLTYEHAMEKKTLLLRMSILLFIVNFGI